jgi:ABC-type transporter Mla subunit MlaD
MEELGLSSEAAYALAADLMPVAEAMEELDDQSEKFDGNAATREFLQMAAGSNELANNLLILAEEQTGLSRNGEHTRSVMAALLEIMEALPPEAEAAAMAAFGMSGGIEELEAAATGAEEAVGGLNDQLPQSERFLLAQSEAARELGAALDEIFGLTPEGDTFDFLGSIEGGVGAVVEITDAMGGLVDVISGSAAGPLADFIGLVSEVLPDAASRSGSISDLAGALGDVGDEAAGAAVSIDDLRGAVDDLIGRFQGLDDAEANLRESTRAVYEEVEQTAEAIASAAGDGLTLAEAFDVATETGRENQRQLEEHAAAIEQHGIDMLMMGASAEEAAGDIAFNTNQLRDHLLAVYDDEDAVDALIATYFRTPKEVNTYMQLIGAAQAQAEAAAIKSSLDNIPRFISSHVSVTASGIGGIAAALANLRAEGGYNDRPELAVWGEAGAEVMFPLTDPSRIRDLWADPRVSGPMISALGFMPSAASAASSAAVGGDRPIVIEYHDHGGGGLTTEDIARGVRRALVTA